MMPTRRRAKGTKIFGNRSRITPFGRRSTFFPSYAPVMGPDGQLAGWRKNIYSFPPIGSPDGGAYTTVGDLSRFIQALKRGALLSPTLTRDMLTPQVRWGKYGRTERWMGYGFEFAVQENDPGEVLCARKDGVNAGVVCTLRYYPGTDSLIVILGNQECDLEDIARRVEGLVLGFEVYT